MNKQNGEALEGLRALEVLELRSVRVSTEALASIKKLENLKQIDGHDCDGAFTSEDDVRKKFPNVKVTLLK